MEGDKRVNDRLTGPWFSAFSDGHFTKAEKSAFLPTCLMNGKNCNSALGVGKRLRKFWGFCRFCWKRKSGKPEM